MKKNVFDKNPPHDPSYLYFIKDFQVVESGLSENGVIEYPNGL
ncbi:hypothetical protein [uncultured Prevotella sp.]|nr:hypothetical protein [uncultured Prevotella sp.]